MAAAATKSSNDSSHTKSKMSSPKDSKRNIAVKKEDPPGNPPEDAGDVKPVTTTASNSNNTQPLAPPPKPSQNNPDAPDYFNTNHNNSNQFSLEPNPFEQSFGGQSGETPGRSILPPVASITSPSPLPGVTPGWNSLRSGPLSPAMLAGPTGTSDYFGDGFRGGFPTPNESSLRTGLTPGGGGSMFPAPSPNSQALFNSLQSGGATPSTLDFHRTALNAAAAANTKYTLPQNGSTSQPQEQSGTQSTDRSSQQQQQQQQQQQNQKPQPTAPAPAPSQPQQQQQQQAQPSQPTQQQQQPSQQRSQDPFGSHDVSSAANDLLSFASQANGARSQQFTASNQPNAVQPPSQEIQRRNTKGSVGTNMSGSVDGGEGSDSGQSEHKSTTRSRGKKGAAGSKNTSATRRKAEDTKGPTPKKQKGNNGAVVAAYDDDEDMMSDDDMTSPKMEGEGGRKMTDEEKRKNFLERNRVAALKCRQRKKQWLANLQAKVELFSTENDALSAQVTQLREEVVNLKTLLLAHKDCPVSQAQGLGGMAMNSFIGDINHHANPYGMAMGNGMMQMSQGQMQRS